MSARALPAALAAAALGACVARSAPEPGARPAAIVEAPQALAPPASADALEPFLARARAAAAEGAARTLESLVARWPDLALRALRERPGAPEGPALAAALARACGDAPEARAAYEPLRAAFLADPRAPEPARALGAWAAGAGARSWLALEGATLLLEQRAGAQEPAAGAPLDAAWTAAFARARAVADPALWERLLALRPLAAAPWPADAELAEESLAWSRVAELRLARGEAREALLAACRARATARAAPARARAALALARVAYAEGRSGDALLALRGADAAPTPAAIALEGVLVAEQDDLAGGRALLETALAQEGWRGRARAASDLSVVLVLLDDEGASAALERAEALCAQEEDWSALACVWRNRAAWLAAHRREDAARTWTREAEALARERGLLDGP